MPSAAAVRQTTNLETLFERLQSELAAMVLRVWELPQRAMPLAGSKGAPPSDVVSDVTTLSAAIGLAAVACTL